MLPSTAALTNPSSFGAESRNRLEETAIQLSGVGAGNVAGQLAPWLSVAGSISARALAMWPQIMNGSSTDLEWTAFDNAIMAIEAGRNLMWHLAKVESEFIRMQIARYASMHKWAYSDMNLARREIVNMEPPAELQAQSAPIRFDQSGSNMIYLWLRDPLFYGSGRDGYADALVMAAGTVVET